MSKRLRGQSHGCQVSQDITAVAFAPHFSAANRKQSPMTAFGS